MLWDQKTCLDVSVPPRVTLTSGNFKLILNKKDEVLWIGPEKVGQPVEIPALTELFGFGSGDFAQNNAPWFKSHSFQLPQMNQQ